MSSVTFLKPSSGPLAISVAIMPQAGACDTSEITKIDADAYISAIALSRPQATSKARCSIPVWEPIRTYYTLHLTGCRHG